MKCTHFSVCIVDRLYKSYKLKKNKSERKEKCNDLLIK